MKKFASVLLLFFTFLNVDAQYFWGASYYPNPCFEQDSITIIDTVSLPEINDQQIDSAVFVLNDTIFIHLCYSIAGGPQMGKTFIESHKIGKLNYGHYIVKIEGTQTVDTACNTGHKFLNTMTFPLDVQKKPTGINEDILKSRYYSTQLINDKLDIDILPICSSVKVYDIRGHCCFEFQKPEKPFVIETSNWPNGIYFVSIQTNEEQKRYRVIKD